VAQPARTRTSSWKFLHAVVRLALEAAQVHAELTRRLPPARVPARPRAARGGTGRRVFSEVLRQGSALGRRAAARAVAGRQRSPVRERRLLSNVAFIRLLAQEAMVKTLRVLDSSGDRVIEFDESEAATSARREAKALFERMLASGSVAFRVNRGEGKPDEKVTDFSALESETVVVPRVVGG
jgi:hypothetical protein